MNVTLADGLVLLQSRLPPEEQRELWQVCRTLSEGPVPMYTPTIRGGRKMSVGMLCLGKHWNGLTYQYEECRSDFDGLAVPQIPPRLAEVARTAAADAGFTIQPDLCRDPTFPIMLKSGDVVVMGGPSRLRYHGITRILPGTAPLGTGPGRFNLTFRQW